jgi:hypothetical protein
MKKPIEGLELAETLNPLVATINFTYGNATSRLLHFKPLGSSSVYAAIEVADQDADIFSGVIQTLLLRGGLYSHTQPSNGTMNPAVFQFRKEILCTSSGVSHFYFLIAQVDPFCLRKALRLQVTLLRAILVDPLNILPGVSPELSLRKGKADLVPVGL